MPKFAVIDCGTNTFHLLIAQPKPEGGFTTVYRERRFIKLAEDGIQRISENAYQRALSALETYAQKINEYQVAATRVSGTAALRTAENGPQFVAEVKAKTGLEIAIIPGKEEAQLIYEGVRQAIGPQEAPWMVMDIGGGSVEFIIVDQTGVKWFESFPVGVAVLYKKLHQTEPISSIEIEQTQLFLKSKLVELELALSRFPTHHLVGAAGTFDVIANILGTIKPTPHCDEVALDGFENLYQQIIAANQEERHTMADIPDDRADMIVVAMILVKLVLKIAKVEKLTVSRFSMKEGMLDRMLAEQKES
jgi:exopolyphosphatase/guanosine-5'-triphosphate,3'-diphosphate pyrophosphatase